VVRRENASEKREEEGGRRKEKKKVSRGREGQPARNKKQE
jgi:hypothetical protein